MIRPCVPAKLSRPRLFNITNRNAVFALLDEKQTNHPVIWITGSPGSGKTALVSSYTLERNLPVLWYLLDSGDNDIAAFFGYLAQASGEAAEDAHLALPTLIPEDLQDLANFSRRFFRSLFARLPANTVVVLDNYHTIDPASVFHEVIQQAMQELPHDIHLQVISRTAPPPRFARLVASNLLGQIDETDLYLTAEEICLIAHKSGLALDEVTLQLLQNQSEGWVTGLMLMLEQIKQSGASNPSASIDNHLVSGYFSSEVFDPAPQAMREFMIRTALLPYMTAEMADQMDGCEHSRKMLEQLCHHRSFINRQNGKALLYRYHPLFRHFLIDQFNRYFSPDESRCILQTGATLMEQHGDVETAAELLARAQAWEEDQPPRLIMA